MEECSLINLSETDYSQLPPDMWSFIENPTWRDKQALDGIYHKYCAYKKFTSHFPLFDKCYDICDILGYYDNGKLVAFSCIMRWDDTNAETWQFAWDYENPKLHLGIKSLRNECAVYKALGYKYLYLGDPYPYKEKMDGYMISPPLQGLPSTFTNRN